MDEKKVYDIEVKKLKSELDGTKHNTEMTIRDRENEIRILKEVVTRFDPEFFNKNLLPTGDKIRECPDCLRKE